MNSEKYIGLDVHQATISVAVMDSTGKLVMESIQETKAGTILEFLAEVRGTLSVTFFEAKAADVIGLYLAPPQHAAVFCVDEKTAIQALDRLDPVLPLSPGRLERHGFEYRRTGTLSLYAALEVKTGKVQGKTAERHTSAEFVNFLDQVVSGCKPNQQIHIILDNLSAHKTSQVGEFLERNTHVKLHFTPTYSSWLNQVEIWFARLERDVIARGIFTSVKDLSRKLMRYIRAYSKTARPFKWKYSDLRRRILPC